MTSKKLLISCISQLSENDISSLLDTVMLMTMKNTPDIKPHCPYCGSAVPIRQFLI